MGVLKEIKGFFLVLIIILTLSSLAFAVQPTQQYNQIYLSPYYSAGFSSGVTQTYNLSIYTPDGISQVKSAIIKFHAYILPSVTYTLTISGKSCNNPTYAVSTTQASAGVSDVSFDCSNIINSTGDYTILLTANKNTGAITGTLDLTYMNNPSGTMQVHGTEYNSGEPAKVWLQLLNNSKQSIDNAVCYVDIYTPDNEEYLERAEMTSLNHDGIYYFDLVAPAVIGVYPTIATCYYTASSTKYTASNYFINTGVYTTGTINDTNNQDGSFLRIRETTSGIRNISIGINYTNLDACLNISESLFTGINIETFMKFDSSVGDDLTISIYNYTSNTWLPLPNKHLSSNAFTTTSNTLFFNNLTKSGLYNKTKGGLTLRINDTQIADNTQSNLDMDLLDIKCLQLANPNWETTKGSSEIHIGIADNGLLFGVNSLCNFNDLSSGCGVFYQNTTLMPEQQGLIMENITILNYGNLGTTSSLNYETGSTIDCSAIIEVVGIHNNSRIDKTNTTYYSAGSGRDNCNLKIPVELIIGEPSFQIQIIMENYAKWEVLRANDILTIINATLSNFCYAFNYTYEIPIVNPVNLSNGYFAYCNRILDDIYWYDTLVRNDASTVNTIGQFESYITEERFYYPILLEEYTSVQGIAEGIAVNNNSNKLNQILSILQNGTIGANYSSDFNATQNLINIQTQNILNHITSQVNLTRNDIIALNNSINNQFTILSAKVESGNTNLTLLINTQTQSILNTLSQNYNLTTQQINTLNATITGQYNNLVANQNHMILMLTEINTTSQYLNQSLASQLAFLNLINTTLYQQSLLQIQINQTNNQILNQTQVNEAWLVQIWNYLTGYLSNLTQQINLTTLQNQVYLTQLINNSNTTTNIIFLSASANPCVTGTTWTLDMTATNQYNIGMNYPQISCSINTTIYGVANMTSLGNGNWQYTNTCPAPSNWSYSITCS